MKKKKILSVEKIGGTSMSHFKEVLHNIILNKGDQPTFYNRLFVVSAYSNVTNLLLENKKNGKPGIYSDFVQTNSYAEKLNQLLDRLISINNGLKSLGLELDKANEFIRQRISQTEDMLMNISELVASGYVNRNSIYLTAREILASIGEAHSAFNSANIISNNGLNAVFIDLSGYHDSEYLSIDQRIRKSFSGIDISSVMPIVTGYTKGTEGIMRKFDRGYSEVTFAKIASLLRASQAIIHKEYHFCSADPGIVGEENAIPVCNTNYDVADQLADIWMEAVHPAVSKTLELAGIDLCIKNSFDPEHNGTLISKNFKNKESKVEIISGNKNVMVIEIHDPAMVGTVGFDKAIMDIFVKHSTSYLLKATNANSISIVIRRAQTKELIHELHQSFYQVVAKKAAIVCILGTNIGNPGILAQAARALADNKINIECVSQSLRQVNIQFVVNIDQYEEAVRALNRTFNP